MKPSRRARVENVLKAKCSDRKCRRMNLLRILSYILSHLIFAILCKESNMYYSITLIRKLRLKEYYITAWFTGWVSSSDRTESRSFLLRVQYVFHYHKHLFSIILLTLEYIPLQMPSYSLRIGTSITFSTPTALQLVLQSFTHCYYLHVCLNC